MTGSRPPSTSRTELTGPPAGLLEVGQIDKAHGVGGDVVVRLITDRCERVAVGAVLFLEVGELHVVRSRPHQDRFVVHFEGVDDRPAADVLRGTKLYAPPIDEPGTLWFHELIGAVVIDQNGQHLGTVETVQANPASDLLVLDSGVLIPVVFVIDHEPGVRVKVDVPEGLTEL